jgi:RND superfamily putative drug exporter
MFFALGRLVARHWIFVTLFWVVVVVAARRTAPEWNSVAYDGDLSYLPKDSSSLLGREWLPMFGENRSRSQIVVVFEQAQSEANPAEMYVQWKIARDLQFVSGVSMLEYANGLKASKLRAALLDDAEDALNDAIYLDELLSERYQGKTTRLAAAYWHRARIYDRLDQANLARDDRLIAVALAPELADQKADREKTGDEKTGTRSAGLFGIPPTIELTNWVDVWTWRDDVFGPKLVSENEQARLIVIQLANEFLAVRNSVDVAYVHSLVAATRRESEGLGATPTIGVSGSAAFGTDLLKSAKECIRHTEWFTVALVVLILALVYRSPMLVVVPLLSIGVALVVSVALIAVVASWSHGAEGAWYELRIFTTTRVFLVVILFGAGTDYCLFLISRYREELMKTADRAVAMSHAMRGVGEALSASALTTIVGLSMMWFADFGKFRFSGPVIALALMVALVTCLTLTPAILYGCTRFLFWPGRVEPPAIAGSRRERRNLTAQSQSWIEAAWGRTADSIVRRPVRYLVFALVAMLPFALAGVFLPRFTYDSLSSLDASQPSREGAEIMRRYFPIGESSPITVLVDHPTADFADFNDRLKIRDLAGAIYKISGVEVVRSISDPLGDFPPDREFGLVDRQAWRTMMSRPHRRTSELFLGRSSETRTNAARMDIVVTPDPFSIEAANLVAQIESTLDELSGDRDSFWEHSEFRLAGTMVGFRDLREVTQSDTRRIRWLTVLAVYIVLIGITRRPGVSAYMIVSVLLTYLVTLGAIWLIFSATAGENFEGLDWRVPLFLFVILVAIGQDYNVYLAMRVFEEQKILGPIRGVREAVAKTGGIITSCGLVMAGTFFSMTATAWSPWLGSIFGIESWANDTGYLQSIVQLGAALSLGVLLDTFVVRSILLPSFLVLLCHVKRKRRPDS